MFLSSGVETPRNLDENESPPKRNKGDIDYGEEYYYGTVGKDGNGPDRKIPDYSSTVGDGVIDPKDDGFEREGGNQGKDTPGYGSSTGAGVTDPSGGRGN